MGSVGALVIRSHRTREIWGKGKCKNLIGMALRGGNNPSLCREEQGGAPS